ncbi:hypothetical protein HK405_009490 [Cladochytrium tenue]|nr:hypothetical protein HK405_009490 [Cladochytrium tenue]
MSPLTRGRADTATRAPTHEMEVYYGQRAGAGLIISEGVAISEQGYGWQGSPAMYTEEHAAAWKHITDRVHSKGSKIVMQLWHTGRQSHSSFHNGAPPVSASAIRLEIGHARTVDYSEAPYETPRELSVDDITAVVEEYRRSAELAKLAGFDGVEIHGANGYLIDQFLQSVTNHRTDRYGGSFENRARILLEVVEAIQTVWPSDRIAVRLSPNGAFGGVGAPDNADMFEYVAERLAAYGLAYLAIIDAGGFLGFHGKCRPITTFDAKKAFKGVVIANGSYTRDTAEGALRSGSSDLVAFGRLYISNPDLAERFQNDWPLNPSGPSEAYYGHRLLGKPLGYGYTDFPAFQSS